MIRTRSAAALFRPALALVFLGASIALLAARDHLTIWASLSLLGLAGVVGLAVQMWTDRAAGAKTRLLGPLGAFTIVFVAVLAIRAVPLALGADGRYFVVEQGTAGPLVTRLLSEDKPEEDLETFPEPEFPVGHAPQVSPDVRVTRAISYRGSSALQIRTQNDDSFSYVALQLPIPDKATAPVAAGVSISSSIAWTPVVPLPPGAQAELFVRYLGRDSSWLQDQRLDVDDSPKRREWVLLEGRSVVPDGAEQAAPLLLVRSDSGGVVDIAVDAPLAVPGVDSTRQFLSAPSQTDSAGSFNAAAAIAAAMLLATVGGFLLRLGEATARLVPPLEFASLRARSTRLLLVMATAVGITAYVAEMILHGGYLDYVSSLSDAAGALQGKWYLRAFALIPTGITVMLLARRIRRPNGERFGRLEWSIVAVGTLIPLSYLLKAAIAIPLLTILLFWYLVSRRALIWLVATGIVGALLLPIVYVIRFEGFRAITDLFSAEYWNEFGTNVTSRFFHFESLMIAAPEPSSEPFWRPIVDFFATAIPRFIWEGKPDSAATRFTREHLLHGLNTGTDIGVLSLPGEVWILGGATAVVVVGFGIGLLLSLASGLVRRGQGDGTLLLAAGLVTYLVFLNDGWGMASATIEALIASVGWLVFLRPVRGTSA